MSFGLWSPASLLQPALEMWISECSACRYRRNDRFVLRSFVGWEDGALSRLNHSATQPFFFSPLFPKVKEESGRHAERIQCAHQVLEALPLEHPLSPDGQNCRIEHTLKPRGYTMMRLLLALAFSAGAVNGTGDEGAATHPPRSQRPAHNAPTSRTARRRFQPTRIPPSQPSSGLAPSTSPT